MMRKTKLIPEQYYHIYNRGNNKQIVFLTKRDYVRFLFNVLFFQSPIKIYNPNDRVSDFMDFEDFNISKKKIQEIIDTRTIEIVSFSFLPNHFHLIIKEIIKGGISIYMMRIQDAFTKYINVKNNRSGHLFEGPFKSVHIEDNNQFLYLSSYIHRNPRELSGWKNKEHLYPWSSYQDYIGKNRWEELIKPEIILEQFKTPEEYRKFVDKSMAKEKIILPEDHFLT